MALQLITTLPGAAPQRLALDPGRTRVQARPGAQYRVIDDAGQVPPGVTIKRLENALIVEGLPDDRSLEIGDFFSACGPDGATTCQISTAELGGSTGPITPSSDPIGALPDGSFLLYGSTSTGGQIVAPPVIAGADNAWKAIGTGVGGLAIAGLAVGAGGGGGGSSADTTAPPAPTLTGKAVQNSGTPTFTGTGEPGSIVLVRIDLNGNGVAGDGADPSFQTTVGADGIWTLNLAGAAPVTGTWGGSLPDAPNYVVSAVSRDAAGNVSATTSGSVAIDTRAPAAPGVDAIAGDGVVSGAEAGGGVNVTGTGEAGASVRITWGSASKTGTVGADGRWSLLFGSADIPATQGATSVQAVLTDAAGNISPETQTSVVVDTVGPAAPTITSGALTNSVQPNITGLAEPGSTVQLSIDQANDGTVDLVYSTQASPAGIWEVNIATAVPAGGTSPATLSDLSTDGLLVRAADTTGNQGPSTAATLSIDVTAPSAPSIAAISGGFINSAERAAGVVISGTLDPVYANRPVTISFGSGEASKVVNATGTTWSATFSASELPSVDSAYTVTAVTSSVVGQASLTGTRSVVVDTVSPAAPGRSLAADTGVSAVDGITSNGSVNVTGLEGGATWQYSTNAGASWTAGAGTFVTLTGDGAKSITFSQIDAAGNVGAPSTALGFTLDTTPPAAPGSTLAVDSGSSATDGVTKNGQVNVSGLEVGATWEYTLDGGTNWQTGTGASFTITTDGVYSVQVRQTDAAGVISSTSAALPVTLDRTVATTPSITFKLEDDAPLTYADIDGSTGSEPANPDKTPTLTFNLGALLAAGETIVINRTNLDNTSNVDVLTLTSASAAGNTVVPTPTALPTGVYIYTGTFTDAAGNSVLLDIDGAGTDGFFTIKVA